LNGRSGVVYPLTPSAESQIVVFISYRTEGPKRRKFRGSLISCLGGVRVDDSMPQRDQIFCRPNESASGFLKVSTKESGNYSRLYHTHLTLYYTPLLQQKCAHHQTHLPTVTTRWSLSILLNLPYLLLPKLAFRRFRPKLLRQMVILMEMEVCQSSSTRTHRL
jgi:hypothetical protein